MNDLAFSLSLLDSIYKEARRDDMTFAERAGLYAATSTMYGEFRKYITEERNKDGYAFEKLGKYKWHIGAALGFDITNGHDKSQHLVWALGDLSTLRKVLTEGNKDFE